MPLDITSFTLHCLGDFPLATARTVMSRSVTTPTRRSFSPTGNEPQSNCLISFAACSIVSLGDVRRTFLLIICCTCMESSLWSHGPPKADWLESCAASAKPFFAELSNLTYRSRSYLQSVQPCIPLMEVQLAHSIRLGRGYNRRVKSRFGSRRDQTNLLACLRHNSIRWGTSP